MKNKTLLTLCAASMLLSVNAMAQKTWDTGAASVSTGDAPYSVTIDDNYTGSDAINVPGDPIVVNEISYNRNFSANVPSTIVLPFTLPEGTTINNAKFYELDYVIPDLRNENKTWLARMKRISGLPQANTPYAVIMTESGKMVFNLNGQNASFKTTSIAQVSNSNYNTSDYKPADIDYPVTDNSGDWYLTGTYKNEEWSAGDEESSLCYGFSATNGSGVIKGQFGRFKTNGGTTSKPMRSYLCKTSSSVRLPLAKQSANGATMFSLPESINVEFVDTDASGKEHTTYVGKLNRIDNVRLNRERSTFDLKGRNVNSNNTAKGVYFKK